MSHSKTAALISARAPLDVAMTRLNVVLLLALLLCTFWFRRELLPESSDIFHAGFALMAPGALLVVAPVNSPIERWSKLLSRAFIALVVAATCWHFAYEYEPIAPTGLALRLTVLFAAASSALGETTPVQRALLNVGRLLALAVWLWLGISAAA